METVASGSVWDVGVSAPSFDPLRLDTEADVVVIGAGISGITAAYLLAVEGRRVVLLEQKRALHGATGATTAFLTQYIDTELADLAAMFGEEETRDILASHGDAIDEVERIISQEGIACEFLRCPSYIYAHSRGDIGILQGEYETAQRIRFPLAFRQDNRLPFAAGGYLYIERQAKFHPLRYLTALLDRLQELGVRIYEHSEVVGIEENGGRVRVVAHSGSVRAGHAVMATYVPVDHSLFFKKGLYTSYVLEARVSPDALPEAIYEDTYNPYHYFRVDRQGEYDRIIFGGSDHRRQIPVHAEKNFQSLADEMERLFAGIPYTIVRRWSGPIVEPADGLAFIGRLRHKRVWYMTGFSGNGMTYGTLAAMIIADSIAGRENAWASLYDARRTPTPKQLAYKGYDYTQEVVGGALKNTFRHREP